MMTDMQTYDRDIKPHLVAAQEYAFRATREISRLPARPAFFTLAQDELANARRSLETMLAYVKAAEAEYEAKPLEAA